MYANSQRQTIRVIGKIKMISHQNGIKKNDGMETFSPALVVAASLWCGGEDVGGCGPWLCLWAKISTGPWMVHSDVIEKIRIISCQNSRKQYERRETISPVLMVAASLWCGGEGVGGGGPWLCLWAKISTGPWMVHSNVIEK